MAIRADDIKGFSPEMQRQIINKTVAEEKHRNQKKQSQSKYRNVKEKRGALTFDSKKEARHYDDLVLRQNNGEIRDLKLQPEFTLQEAFTTLEGTRIQAVRYRADFSYTEPITDDDGNTYWVLRVEDAKGVRTDVYRLKRKWFRDKYGFDITEV